MIGLDGRPFAFAYAGFSLDGTDDLGCEWTTGDEDGWFSSPAIRSGTSEGKSGQDGEWPSTPLRGARVVRLSGKVRSPNGIGTLETAIRRFAALPLTGFLVGYSDTFTLTGSAQIEDAPAAKIIASASLNGPRQATWQVTWKLPDPFLYGPDTFDSTGLSGAAGTGRVWPRVWPRDWGVPAGQTPGSIAVPNNGEVGYWPRIRIDAGDARLDNPVITLNETGDWVRYKGSLAAGQYLDIDCANRRVLLNGQVSVSPKVSFSGRFLGIPVGGGSLSWAADSNGANALMSVFAREGAWL
jgi:hypothetical protein